MAHADILVDAFNRIRESVHHALDGLNPGALGYRVGGSANSIGWLVWHLSRVQDDHIADAAGIGQVWLEEGWEQRFGLTLDPRDIGYGHTAAEVAAVTVSSAELLTGYHDAVHRQTVGYLQGLTATDMARIVDAGYDPPVTLATRLVSVVSDDLQHVGQAAFVRGLLPRPGSG